MRLPLAFLPRMSVFIALSWRTIDDHHVNFAAKFVYSFQKVLFPLHVSRLASPVFVWPRMKSGVKP